MLAISLPRKTQSNINTINDPEVLYMAKEKNALKKVRKTHNISDSSVPVSS